MGNAGIDEDGGFYPLDPNIPIGYDLFDWEDEINEDL